MEVYQMSGKLIFKTRKGQSRDDKYAYYLEWYMEIEGEDGVKTRLSPRYDEFADFIKKVLVHEYRNDATRDRKEELGIKYRTLMQGLAQMEIDMVNIPYKYYAANMTKEELDSESCEETVLRLKRESEDTVL